MYRYYLSKLVHKKIKELDLGAELLCKKCCLVTPMDIIALSFSFGYHLKVMYYGQLPRLVANRRNVSY